MAEKAVEEPPAMLTPLTHYLGGKPSFDQDQVKFNKVLSGYREESVRIQGGFRRQKPKINPKLRLMRILGMFGASPKAAGGTAAVKLYLVLKLLNPRHLSWVILMTPLLLIVRQLLNHKRCGKTWVSQSAWYWLYQPIKLSKWH